MWLLVDVLLLCVDDVFDDEKDEEEVDYDEEG